MTRRYDLVETVFEGVDLRGNRLAHPWRPDGEPTGAAASVIVQFDTIKAGQGYFGTVQEAIDHVVALGRDHTDPETRHVISVGAGYFEGPIVVPKGAPPMDIRGAGQADTIIAAGIDAGMSGMEYDAKFRKTIENAAPRSKEQFCKISARQKISTGNTAVLRICADDVTLSGLTIRNTYACDRIGSAPKDAEPDVEGRFARGQHQAVALMLDAVDKVTVRDCALSSFQDTLYLKAEIGKCTRSAFYNCDIEGDVDFVFGGATAYFESCTIRSKAVRTVSSWALAPSTPLFASYGFVFHSCRFMDDGLFPRGRAFLGRQWFEGVRATPYGVPTIPGYSCTLSDQNSLIGTDGQITKRCLERVGKAALFECQFGTHLNAEFWDDWSSGLWTPRYRPVQGCVDTFLEALESWLPADLSKTYASLGSTPWLSQDGVAFSGLK